MGAGKKADLIERDIYSIICRNNGIKAREIAEKLSVARKTVNRYLYLSPYMSQLCYMDKDNRWHGRIKQELPHRGLRDFCGYFAGVSDFMATDPEEWFEELLEGCRDNGRNLNDTRGLFHSFKDSHDVMQKTFALMEAVDKGNWEIAFETRIKLSDRIRIYADILVLTEKNVFSIEFKMKDETTDEELLQCAKYAPYLEVIFGKETDVIPALCLTRAEDLYTYMEIPGTSGVVPVCSGDMLFNLFDEYLGFLEE